MGAELSTKRLVRKEGSRINELIVPELERQGYSQQPQRPTIQPKPPQADSPPKPEEKAKPDRESKLQTPPTKPTTALPQIVAISGKHLVNTTDAYYSWPASSDGKIPRVVIVPTDLSTNPPSKNDTLFELFSRVGQNLHAIEHTPDSSFYITSEKFENNKILFVLWQNKAGQDQWVTSKVPNFPSDVGKISVNVKVIKAKELPDGVKANAANSTEPFSPEKDVAVVIPGDDTNRVLDKINAAAQLGGITLPPLPQEFKPGEEKKPAPSGNYGMNQDSQSQRLDPYTLANQLYNALWDGNIDYTSSPAFDPDSETGKKVMADLAASRRITADLEQAIKAQGTHGEYYGSILNAGSAKNWLAEQYHREGFVGVRQCIDKLRSMLRAGSPDVTQAVLLPHAQRLAKEVRNLKQALEYRKGMGYGRSDFIDQSFFEEGQRILNSDERQVCLSDLGRSQTAYFRAIGEIGQLLKDWTEMYKLKDADFVAVKNSLTNTHNEAKTYTENNLVNVDREGIFGWINTQFRKGIRYIYRIKLDPGR